MYNFRDRLIQTMGKNRVCVVEGDTGSGKTTQVPQFLLEDACGRAWQKPLEPSFNAFADPRYFRKVLPA